MRTGKLLLTISILNTMMFASCGEDLRNNYNSDSVISEVATWMSTVQDIVGDVGGKHIELYSTDDSNYVSHKSIKLIALNIDSCSFVLSGLLSRQQVATYCATQIFLRLDSGVIKKHDAINVVFDNHTPGWQFDSKEYYYSMEELDAACKAFIVVGNYLSAINENDINEANELFDTTYFGIVPSELHESVKRGINHRSFVPFNCYDYYDYTSKDSSIAFKCFAIWTGLLDSNKIRTTYSFMIPMKFSEQKIINFRLPIEQ